MNYLRALALFHLGLTPETYVEIGCRKGISLAQARCPSIAIDPDFEITAALGAPTRLFRETSDRFFADRSLRELLGGPVDFAFIDGMHQAEFVLRDLLNLEAAAQRNSVIVIDDVLPEQIEWTTRERQTQAWTGDVYKIVPFLRKHRPDLQVEVFDIKMKGLAVVTKFDPGNRSVQARLGRHEARLAGDQYACDSIEALRRTLRPRPAAELPSFIQDLKRRRGGLVPADGTNRGLYLDLLKRSLLNETYLDDELRIAYLRDCLQGDETFDYAVLHEIRTRRPEALADLAASRRVGRFPQRNIHRSGFSHTMMGRLRLDSLQACLDDLLARRIPGDLVECGVWRGGGCILMAGWLEAHGIRDRRIVVADSFEGLPEPSHASDAKLDLSKDKFPELAVSLQTVQDNFAAYGLLDHDRLRFVKGWFRDTLGTAPSERIALLRLDGDLYESTRNILDPLYDRVSPGGIVIVDDYALPMCRQAVEDFFAERNEPVPETFQIDWTGAFFIKPGGASPA